MLDSLGRNIDYMRVSITDRCNLRCGYCVPDGFKHVSHSDILRYEEILRLCRIIASTGVKTIRVTGGEPLARKGWASFIRRLKAINGIECVTMTTNAILLKPFISELAKSGIDGLNISLDTLDPETYKKITGVDELPTVLANMESVLDIGIRVKINSVLLRGLNEKDILPIAKMAETMPIDIRFIELMPTVGGRDFQGVAGDEVLDVLKGVYPDIEPDLAKRGRGPAKYYQSSSLIGKIGFINAVSDHICSNCNRLRLSSRGFLKLCLNYNIGLDLKEMLQSAADDDKIRQAVIEAVYNKPKRHTFGLDDGGIEGMSKIGG